METSSRASSLGSATREIEDEKNIPVLSTLLSTVSGRALLQQLSRRQRAVGRWLGAGGTTRPTGHASLGGACRSSQLTPLFPSYGLRQACEQHQPSPPPTACGADRTSEPYRQLVVEKQLEALPPVLLAALVQLIRLLQEGQHILQARGACSIQGSGHRA